MFNSFKNNSRGLVTKLMMGVLWSLLAWQIAVAIPQVPARSISDWITLLLPSTVLGTLLIFVAVVRTEGRFIWSPSEATSGLKESLVILPGLFVTATLLAATGFFLMERLGYFLAFPIMVALLCLVGVLALSVGGPGAAVALFLAIYPILSYIQVQETYWDKRAASIVFVPVDVIDPSLLDSPLAQLVQMPPSVLFVVALAGGWLLAIFRRRINLSRTPLDWPIAMFVLFYFISSMLSNDVGVSTSYFVEAILAPVLLYYVIVHSVRSETWLQVVLLTMLSSGILGFLYHLHKLAVGGASTEFLSTSFFFGNANLSAGLLVLLLPVAMVLFTVGGQRTGVRVVALIGLVSCIAELLLGGTRGAWIAAIVQLVLLLAFNKRIRAYAWGFVFPLLGFLAYLAGGTVSTIVEDRLGFLGTGEVPIDALARFAIWREALNLMIEHPLTGIGPGTFRAVGVEFFLEGRWYPSVDAHNTVLSIGAEAGLIAALAFVWLSLIVLAKGIRDFRTMERDSLRQLLFGMVVSIVGFWITGLITGAEFSHYHILAGTPILWAIMGLIVVADEVRHE